MTNISVNCPFCAPAGLTPDTTRNLHVRADGIYNCFRCGAKPSKTGPLPAGLCAGITQSTIMQKGVTSKDIPTRKHFVHDCLACASYITTRGMNPCKVPYGVYGGWCRGHRIFFRPGEYWQGRAINPRNPLPYYASPGIVPELMDMDSTKGRNKTLCVVEGPFDGLRLYQEGFRAVVLFGKTYTDAKLTALQNLQPKKIIWCLDKDVLYSEWARWFASSISIALTKSWTLLGPGKDPAKASPLDIKNLRRLVKRRT